MTFVNEHIPVESNEAKRFGLPELAQRFHWLEVVSYWLAIDRTRNLFLRIVEGHRGSDPENSDKALYGLNIDGAETLFRLQKVASEGLTMLRWRLLWIGAHPDHAFDADDPRRGHEITGLKEALQLHGSFGELDVSSDFHAVLAICDLGDASENRMVDNAALLEGPRIAERISGPVTGRTPFEGRTKTHTIGFCR